MWTNRITSTGPIRRLQWWVSAVAMALVCLASGSLSDAREETKALRVIAVKTELDLGDRIPRPTGPDYYINGGESDGLKTSMLLDVYRPLRVHDRFHERNHHIQILIGQIKLLRVFSDSAIARLQSLALPSENPLVTNRSVMIGDHVLPRPEGAAPPANISMPSGILFDFDSWHLKPEAFEALSIVAAIIKQHEDQDLVIEGHTCDMGSEDYNLTLSLKRAHSVSGFLIGSGVIPKERVHIVGYGERFPATPNDTEQGRKQNRRVEFRFIPSGTPVPRMDSSPDENPADLGRDKAIS
jgi:outer membrane protein OmpA-like peptidoglycan-associated protein